MARSPSKPAASLDSRDLYPITRVESSPRPGQGLGARVQDQAGLGTRVQDYADPVTRVQDQASLVTRVQDSPDLVTRMEAKPSPSTLPRRPSARVATPTYRYGINFYFL